MPGTKPRMRHYSSGANPLEFMLNAASIGMAAFRNWQRAASNRRAISDLPADRLRDIGQTEAPAPVIEVKAGLITTLMSMR